MDLSNAGAVLTLQFGEAVRLAGPDNRRISAVHGSLWVTQDGDFRDVVLENGADVLLKRPGDVIVQALGGSAVVAVEDGIRAKRGDARPAARLAAWLGRAWRSVGRRLEAARTRDDLHALSDHMLKDIGLRRTEIDCLVR
jgi:uncharacterized protein YjiS (DUF1127 family)